MIRSRLLLFVPTLALACPTDSESGDDGVASNGIDVPTGSGGASESGDASSSSGAMGDTGDGSGGGSTGVSMCPGQENECGGCGPLPETLGEACNGCDSMYWECDFVGGVRCGGFDPLMDDFYPDGDGDGYGDRDDPGLRTCSPPMGWVDNDDDCNDVVITINPDALEVCNGQDDDCNGAPDDGPNPLCDDVCCSFDTVCDGVSACVPKCPGGDICGADLDMCCGAGEVCFAEDCVVPGGDCEFTEQCAVNEVCAQAIGKCVPDDVVPECEFVPPVGTFDPQLACRWTSAGLSDPLRDDVVATPVVINLTDDNLDMVTDSSDIPDIAFLTYDYEGTGCCNTNATLRIVSGECNGDGTMNTIASINSPVLTNDTGLAAGDLDGDGVAELVTVTKEGSQVEGTVAFKREADDGSVWSVLWHNTDYPDWAGHTRGGPTISLADLDADGTAEVVIGNVALDGVTGGLLWDGKVTSAGSGGIGNNGFLGPSSAVADIDLDGRMEVIAGNTVYEDDGTVKWTYTYVGDNSNCGGSLPCDGFTAVANFDGDDEGEVIIVRLGEVFLLDDDGMEIQRVALPIDDCSYNESGPPTIADFDGDGRPEVGTASADFNVVVDFDCLAGGAQEATCGTDGILWQIPNQDCTSRVTASSVFDFEGDGTSEVVYADETTFRIFSGTDGTILYEDDTHGSHTRIEMPVIVDVDNDGNAEIIIPENGWGGGTPGIDVFEDSSDNWVRTRRVWNQHGYHITHINEDGSIPTTPEINWLNERFNNYRQNVQPDGLFHAPDAVVAGNLCNLVDLGGDYEIELSVLVRNDGALTIPAGARVHIELDDSMMVYPLADTVTTIDLQPGQFEIINLTLATPMGVTPPFDVRAIIDPDGDMNECLEDNNSLDTLCTVPE